MIVVVLPPQVRPLWHIRGMQARYVLHLASHFQSGQLSDAKIGTMDDATLIAELTKVKGIGIADILFMSSSALLCLVRSCTVTVQSSTGSASC